MPHQLVEEDVIEPIDELAGVVGDHVAQLFVGCHKGRRSHVFTLTLQLVLEDSVKLVQDRPGDRQNSLLPVVSGVYFRNYLVDLISQVDQIYLDVAFGQICCNRHIMSEQLILLLFK